MRNVIHSTQHLIPIPEDCRKSGSEIGNGMEERERNRIVFSISVKNNLQTGQLDIDINLTGSDLGWFVFNK